MKHEVYSELLDKPYIAGDWDCYGLAKRFYAKVYGLELREYARPEDFAWNENNLIERNFFQEGFRITDVALDRLQEGDGILMRLKNAPLTNHIGVYVGNGLFIHHLHDQLSCEHNFGPLWKRKASGIVRHPEIEEFNRTRTPDEKRHILDLLPQHVRRNYQAT